VPPWIRNLYLITTLGAWLIVVGFYFYKDTLPPVGLISIPPAIIVSSSAPVVAKNVIKKWRSESTDE